MGIDRDPDILPVVIDVLKDSRFKRFCRVLNLDKEAIELMLTNWQAGIQHKFQLEGNANFSITIEIKTEDLRQVIPKMAQKQDHFDYIFHDGFSPRSMPELWTKDLFAQYTKMLNTDGRIITYSSAVAVRGGLKECGLEIRKSAPLGRKSGGTVAFRGDHAELANGISILHLNSDEHLRLTTRSAIPYRDSNLNGTRTYIIQKRVEEIEKKYFAYI